MDDYAVAFRKIVDGVSVSCVCLQENVVDTVHPLEADMVYLDMTDCEIDKLIDALLRLKTGHSDAMEAVVHAEWDEHGNCSACHKNVYDDIDADIWSRYTPPRCPNCGAHMGDKVEAL